jgi:hypothetical protein
MTIPIAGWFQVHGKGEFSTASPQNRAENVSERFKAINVNADIGG